MRFSILTNLFFVSSIYKVTAVGHIKEHKVRHRKGVGIGDNPDEGEWARWAVVCWAG